MSRSFSEELALEWSGDHGASYVGELSDDWSFRSPSGGLLSALGVAAMREELRRLGRGEQAPLSCTATFCSVVPSGPVRVEVTPLRVGNAVSQLRARVFAAESDELGLEVSASFGVPRSGPEFCAVRFPEVRELEASPAGSGGVPFAPGVVPRFFQRFEARRAAGNDLWAKDWSAGEAHHARWVRFLDEPRGADGKLELLSLVALADTMPPSVVQYLGPGFEPFIAPSLDLTVHLVRSTTRQWLLCSARARVAFRGYASAEIEIWDDERNLLAFGTQVMLFRKPPKTLP
ncbi:MAG: thioesterase family protein [Polyangiaceae bacterium]|nr:thioesterase family protein [Myxococcales bacterium]MCB9587020.1 thioesterase family protein [Polyangiaceae bacterium]